MRVLILGSTIFLGRHVVDEALRRGHELTLFMLDTHRAGSVLAAREEGQFVHTSQRFIHHVAAQEDRAAENQDAH